MRADGSLEPVVPGSGDKHTNVEIYLPADMAAHIALDGQGGTRDKKKHFCTNCECHLKHRHKPLQLIRVAEQTTVEALASEHDMSVTLLWALNTGRDFDGMFEPHEMSEQHLGNITLPLADGVSSEEAATAPQEAVLTVQDQGRLSQSVITNDQGFGNATAASRKRRANQKAQNDDRPGLIKVSESSLRSVIVASATDASRVTVNKGTVIRVVQTHKMERRSPFVDKYLKLDRERCVSCFERVHSQVISDTGCVAGSAFVPCTRT